MDGVFIGATWSADMRNMMLLSLALYIAVWWLLTPLLGVSGLWIALLVFLGVRGISLLWRTPGQGGDGVSGGGLGPGPGGRPEATSALSPSRTFAAGHQMFGKGGTQPSALIVPPAGSDNDAANFPDDGLTFF